MTPGTTSKTRKYVVPNSVVESLGMHPNFNSAISTYTSAAAGKARVLGQRKLSSQQSRNSNNPAPMKTAISKNSWIGHLSTLVPTVPPQFSNIINNNIQGLSINYSNQIIQQPDPV